MLKNLAIFRIQSGWKPDIDRLKENLSVPNELGHRWKIIRDDSPMIEVHKHALLTIETQEKLIPASVVEKELDIRIANFIKSTGDIQLAKSSKFKKQMRETVLEALWAKAFVTSKFMNIWIDMVNGFLCIDTTSESRIFDALCLMRKSGFPDVHRIKTKYDVGATMRKLLLSEDQEEIGFDVGRSCELVESSEKSIKYKNEPLYTEDVRNHLLHGKRVKKLELTYNDRVDFVLHDTLQISKLSLLDIVRESIHEECEDSETAEQSFDAEFFVIASEYSLLIKAIIDALGDEVEHEEKDAA